MRALIIVIGLALVACGLAIVLGHLGLPDTHEIVKIGSFTATLTRQRPIPAWLGGVTVLTGIVIAWLGTRYGR